MKIAILSWNGMLYSCRRLHKATQQREHQVEIPDPLFCYMNVSPVTSFIHYKRYQLPHFDVMIPRIGSVITYYGTTASRQSELLGSCPLNESVAITRACNKLRSLQLLARQDIDLPLTGITHLPDDTGDLIAMVSGASLVVKLVKGTQGIDVVLAETRQAVENAISAFRGLNMYTLVQEHIAEVKGCDIHYLVVDSGVVAATEWQTKEGDFCSDPHRSGMATVAWISDEEWAIAIKTAQILGLDAAGVDILHTTREPLVMEVNTSPGLEGVETTTDVDIVSQMIAQIEHQMTSEFRLKIGGQSLDASLL